MNQDIVFARAGAQSDDLQQHVSLFTQTFPGASVADQAYLEWLYRDNPDGEMIGFNALVGDKTVATYVCVPIVFALDGARAKALLSLNTATAPDFQGRGLFTRLAEQTYATAQLEGFAAVVGVANQNSIGGFVRKLGFQDVGGLDVRLSPGLLPKIDPAHAERTARFQRLWSRESLQWRLSNPANRLRATPGAGGATRVLGRTQNPLVAVETDLSLDFGDGFAGAVSPSPWWPPMRMSIGLTPEGCSGRGWAIDLPERFKPSPLRLIYRNLNQSGDRLDKDAVLFRFIDFDAF
jgi:GNAT superfamily N-acetyltransferase